MAEGPRSAHSGLPFAVKPDTPQFFSHVDIYKEATLEATVQWAPPVWPRHKALICQFQYRECRAEEWTQLEPQLNTDGLTPVEMQNLEPGTSYQVSGRCQVENGYPWGEWSPALSFQTPFLGEDGSICLALLGLRPPQAVLFI